MTPEEAWMGLLDCSDETHGDSLADDIAHHRPIIDAAYRADLDRLRAVERAAREYVEDWTNSEETDPYFVALRVALGDRAAEEPKRVAATPERMAQHDLDDSCPTEYHVDRDTGLPIDEGQFGDRAAEEGR